MTNDFLCCTIIRMTNTAKTLLAIAAALVFAAAVNSEYNPKRSKYWESAKWMEQYGSATDSRNLKREAAVKTDCYTPTEVERSLVDTFGVVVKHAYGEDVRDSIQSEGRRKANWCK